MSKCCSPKEREEIIEIIKNFNREVPSSPELKIRISGTVESTTILELIQSLEGNTELGENFLQALELTAITNNVTMVQVARALFRTESGCCEGGQCGCKDKSGKGCGCSH